MRHTAKTKHFKSKRGYEKAQAYIHIHIHHGPSKHPYNVVIHGKHHHVEHRKRKKGHKRGHSVGMIRF